MTSECPHPLVLLWWRWYTRYALRKHFQRVMLYGHVEPPPQVPTLYLANHLSFWDGIVLYHLLREHLGEASPRCMIDQRQVEAHPFFRRVGGFSVNRDSPRDAVRAIRHAATLLNSGFPVVVFPQGRIVSPDAPLHLERGFTYILDQAPKARVVVLCLRYEFWEDQRPELLVHLSPPFPAASFGMDSAYLAFTQGMGALRQAAVLRTPGTLLLKGRRSIANLFPKLPSTRK